MSVKLASVVFRGFMAVSKIKKRPAANKFFKQAGPDKAFRFFQIIPKRFTIALNRIVKVGTISTSADFRFRESGVAFRDAFRDKLRYEFILVLETFYPAVVFATGLRLVGHR